MSSLCAFPADAEWKLLLISQASCVGSLPLAVGEAQGKTERMKIYCIDRIAIVPLTLEATPEVVGLGTPVSHTHFYRLRTYKI